MTEITIPESVTIIGDYAFSRCRKLKNVTIPSGAESIGTHAFIGSANHRFAEKGSKAAAALSKADYSFRIPGANYDLIYIFSEDGEEITGLSLYTADTDLTVFRIQEDVTTIGMLAFQSCSGLTEVIFPDSVESIGWRAFYGCGSLTDVIIPESVVKIDDSAFMECPRLCLSVYPDSFAQAFAESAGIPYRILCKAHKIIPKEKTNPTFSEPGRKACWICEICGRVFTDSEGRTEIDEPVPIPALRELNVLYLPEGILEIGEESFVNLNCEAVVIPEGCQTIGPRAFADCGNLICAILPESIIEIAADAFEGCASMQ